MGGMQDCEGGNAGLTGSGRLWWMDLSLTERP
jgi:hypothetical protein